MKKKLTLLIALIAAIFLLFQNICLGKEKKDSKFPTCTTVGHLQCPKGFKPMCPNNAKPSCLFLGTKQQPACMENNKDKITYDYSLNTVICEKIK